MRGNSVGAGGLPDLSQIAEAVQSVAPCIRDGSVIVNKSTVPVGSGNWVRTLLEEALPREGGPKFSVVSNPEFLRQGAAVEDFLYPDRIVLGGEDGGPDKVAKVYAPILRQDFEGGRPTRQPRLIVTDLPSAEMIKYAANAFLASKISFANEVANVVRVGRRGCPASTPCDWSGREDRTSVLVARAWLGRLLFRERRCSPRGDGARIRAQLVHAASHGRSEPGSAGRGPAQSSSESSKS